LHRIYKDIYERTISAGPLHEDTRLPIWGEFGAESPNQSCKLSAIVNCIHRLTRTYVSDVDVGSSSRYWDPGEGHWKLFSNYIASAKKANQGGMAMGLKEPDIVREVRTFFIRYRGYQASSQTTNEYEYEGDQSSSQAHKRG